MNLVFLYGIFHNYIPTYTRYKYCYRIAESSYHFKKTRYGYIDGGQTDLTGLRVLIRSGDEN